MKTLLPLLVVSLLLQSCYKENKYGKVPDTSLFKLYTNSDSIPADSLAQLVIYAEIPAEADESFSSVVFKTSAGTFEENKTQQITAKAIKKTDDSKVKIAETVLRSSLIPETATITVDLFDLKKTISVKFVKSYPETIRITSSSFSVKPSNTSAGEVQLDCKLSKTLGWPSTTNTVTMTAFNSDFSKHLGSFRKYENSSTKAGLTSFTFVIGDSIANLAATSYTGAVFIIGKCAKDGSGGSISDTVKIISTK